MELSLLDMCIVAPGRTDQDTLFDTIEAAARADALGFKRYWLSENHYRGFAHGSPELLIPAIAGTTERIRVGTAGTLLKLHSPLKVAKDFRLLQALFAGRIDLGIAAGWPEAAVAAELLDGLSLDEALRPERYGEKLAALLEHLRGTSSIAIAPSVAPPDVWVMGGAYSARLAARHGAAFTVALEDSRGDSSLAARYRDEFVANEPGAAPRWSVAVAGVCAEADDEARRLVAHRPVPAQSPFSVIGTPAQCRERLSEICRCYETDEVVFLDLCAAPADRLRSIELLAAACGLA